MDLEHRANGDSWRDLGSVRHERGKSKTVTIAFDDRNQVPKRLRNLGDSVVP